MTARMGMRTLVVGGMLLGVGAGRARADAVVVSSGIAVAGAAAVAGGAYEAATANTKLGVGIAAGGVVAMLVAPVPAKCAAGTDYTRGLALRVAGVAALGLAGVLATQVGLNDTTADFTLTGSVGAIGGALLVAGTVLDIVDANAAIAVAPAAIGDRGAPGLAIGGTF